MSPVVSFKHTLMLEKEPSDGGKGNDIAEELVHHPLLDVGKTHGVWLVPDRCIDETTGMLLRVCGGRYGLGKIAARCYRSCRENSRNVFLRIIRVYVAMCRLPSRKKR